MGKLLLDVLAVSFLAIGGTHRMANISIDPDPPKQGKSATVTYAPNKAIVIEATPGGIIRGTCGTDGKFDFVVPAGAQLLLVYDANNTSVSSGYTVTQ